MIAVPTTAGTGSEAQSYALISDAATHAKMACGDAKAAFRIALLDPSLTVSQPPPVTAAAGFDAIAHAVESYVSTRRNVFSDLFAREAWRLLEANYERVLAAPRDLEARGAMQLGAHYAGVAIEHSMLGATHACASPLTERYGTTHGEAIALLLPHVVRWNSAVVRSRYAELSRASGRDVDDARAGDALAARLDELKTAGALDKDWSAAGVPHGDLEMLADAAARQWTGTFNPRPFDAGGALELYRLALQSQFQNV
jgi:alcohol dehydrogenase